MWYLPLHYRKNTTTLDSNRRHFKCTCTDFIFSTMISDLIISKRKEHFLSHKSITFSKIPYGANIWNASQRLGNLLC
uniref:Uncharacterized protein n=1 Tax=Lepeophtheirus salmonis TaxID=72036 RepID=A0A0K2UZ30_LEPSM